MGPIFFLGGSKQAANACNCRVICPYIFRVGTLPETNSSPHEKSPSQKETSLSSIHFQVLLMLVSGISGTQQNVSQLKIDGSWYPKGVLLKERFFSAEWHSHLRQLSLMDFLALVVTTSCGESSLLHSKSTATAIRLSGVCPCSPNFSGT